MAIVGVMYCTIDTLLSWHNFEALALEHASEAAAPGTPSLTSKLDLYRQLEAADAFHVLAATHDGNLVGFLAILAPLVPNFGRMVAVSETFFVARDYRATGAGLRLVRAAEDQARCVGAPSLLITLPHDSDLLKVLPRVGYSEFSHAFLKRVDGVDPDESIPILFDATPTRPQ